MPDIENERELKNKLSPFVRELIKSSVIIALATTPLIGCGVVKLYQGPDRSANDLAYLSFVASGNASLHSIQIDSHSLSPFRANAAILPGTHEVKVIATTIFEECHNLDESFCFNSSRKVFCNSSIDLKQPGHYRIEVRGEQSQISLRLQEEIDSRVLATCSVER